MRHPLISHFLALLCLLLGVMLLRSSQAAHISEPLPVTASTFQDSPLILSDLFWCPGSQYDAAMCGEVINLSPTQTFSVTLEAHIFAPWFNQTITFTFEPQFIATLPNQSNPFRVNYQRDAIIDVSIKHFAVLDTGLYQPLTVVPQQISCGPVHYQGVIEGTLRNDTAFAINGNQIAIWRFNGGSGQLITGDGGEWLQPGKERSFISNIGVVCWEGNPSYPLDQYRSAAQGRRGWAIWLPLIGH